ncbi:hypothetical protein ACS0TY_004177 [Phlomoides rotata]
MDGIASNSFQMKMDRSNHHRVAQVEESDAMKTMIMTLMEKFDAFSSSSPRETLPPLLQERHVQEQQGVQEVREGKIFKEETTTKASQIFKVNNKGIFLNIHKESTMQLQMFKAVVQFPTGFNPGAKPPNNEEKPSPDELLELMFEKMKEKDVKMEEFIKATNNQIKSLEHQMGQIASNFGQQHQKGKFPSTTETNPREHCKAIKLRSGTRYDGPCNPLDEEEMVQEEKEKVNEDTIEEEELELAKEDEEEKGMGTEREKKKEQEKMKEKVEEETRVPK